MILTHLELFTCTCKVNVNTFLNKHLDYQRAGTRIVHKGFVFKSLWFTCTCLCTGISDCSDGNRSGGLEVHVVTA